MLKLLLAVSGAGLFLVALLARGGERKRIDGWIDTLWIRFDDLSREGLSKHDAAIRAATKTIGEGLTFVFGERLLSLRATVISAVASLAALAVADAVRNLYDAYELVRGFVQKYGTRMVGHVHEIADIYRRRVVWELSWGVALVLVVAVAVIAWRRWEGCAGGLGPWWYGTVALALPAAAVLDFIWTARIAIFNPYTAEQNQVVAVHNGILMSNEWAPSRDLMGAELGTVLLILAAGVASDVLLLGGTRWLFRRVQAGSVARVVPMLATALVVGGLVIAVPVLWYTRDPITQRHVIPRLVAESNALDALLCGSLLVLAGTMILHRALWPALCRPLEALGNARIMQNRKLLVAAVGAAMMVLPFINSAKTWQAFWVFWAAVK